jgi:uncharacterized protein
MNLLSRSEVYPYMQRCLHIIVSGVLALISCMDANAGNEQRPAEITLELGRGIIKAEVADTPASRERGMMKRKRFEIDRGMLFVLDAPEAVCLWMKDTGIPLSAAFIDNSGLVVKTVDLEPNSKEEKCAPLPIRYVLEVNRHWFDQNDVKPGSKLYKLPTRP